MHNSDSIVVAKFVAGLLAFYGRWCTDYHHRRQPWTHRDSERFSKSRRVRKKSKGWELVLKRRNSCWTSVALGRKYYFHCLLTDVKMTKNWTGDFVSSCDLISVLGLDDCEKWTFQSGNCHLTKNQDGNVSNQQSADSWISAKFLKIAQSMSEQTLKCRSTKTYPKGVFRAPKKLK